MHTNKFEQSPWTTCELNLISSASRKSRPIKPLSVTKIRFIKRSNISRLNVCKSCNDLYIMCKINFYRVDYKSTQILDVDKKINDKAFFALLVHFLCRYVVFAKSGHVAYNFNIRYRDCIRREISDAISISETTRCRRSGSE